MNGDVRERTRRLVLEHGWNAASYQLVNDTIEKRFFGDAVIGYVRSGRWTIVAGPPVCSPESLSAVLSEWEAATGPHVCYFGAGERFTELLESRSQVGRVTLGSQPSWNPMNWVDRTHRDPSLRMQFNRALNKGVRVREWTALEAERSPALRTILKTWLDLRGLPPLHFLVEPETLGFLTDRRVFVAEQGDEPIAFLVLCPVALRNGWLTEQFPRLPEAPNGTVELMLDFAARTTAAEGSTYLTMGLVPLAHTVEEGENPAWLKAATGWARAHGKRFYNFRGLESFKTKFNPEEWETLNAIVVGREFTPSALYAVASAFSRQPAWKAMAIGIARAVGTEIRSLTRGPR